MNDDRQETRARERARVSRENKEFLDALKVALDAEVQKQGVGDKNFSFLVSNKTDPGMGDEFSLRIYGRDGIQVLVERQRGSSMFNYSYGKILGARVHAYPDYSYSLKMTRRNRAFLGDADTIAPGIVKMCVKYLDELDQHVAKKKATDAVRDAALQKWLVNVIRKVPGLEPAARCRMPDYDAPVHKAMVLKARGAAILAGIHDDGITLSIQVRLRGQEAEVRKRLENLVEFLERQDYQQFLGVTGVSKKERDDADKDEEDADS